MGGALALDEVRLETQLAIVPLRLERSGGRVVFGWMEQPVAPWRAYERTDELLAALGVERSLLPVEAYENGPRHVFVRLESEQAVASLQPDLAALAGHRGVAANCFAGSGGRWKTRMFAPSIGIAEDPATGSGAGPLAMIFIADKLGVAQPTATTHLQTLARAGLVTSKRLASGPSTSATRSDRRPQTAGSRRALSGS